MPSLGLFVALCNRLRVEFGRRRSEFFNNCFQIRHSSTIKDMKYEEAVRTLNLLQNTQSSNKPRIRDAQCLVHMQECLNRIGVTQEQLKNLNIIHISGTKGKGSTSAFVESILRHHGYKTGFFSSPHLIEVRERFRINGNPIPKTLFADYFEEIYDRYTLSAESHEITYPAYFYFLTTMAFHVFISQRVDVAIMEVGIGGAFDCTNVIKDPVVCGVTSLGYDHMDYLGKTIESIAWHKSGIFKQGAVAFTPPQTYSALQVMAQSAFDCNIKLQICPDLSMFGINSKRNLKLGLAGEHQRINASLALQISQNWMRKMNGANQNEDICEYESEIEAFPSPASPFVLTDTHLDALAACQWGGRAQTIQFTGMTFYLDGAHTRDSMKCCSKWFREEANQEERILGSECRRILVFNVTRGRSAECLFRELQDCGISDAIFTPNIATFVETDIADQTNLKSSIEEQLLCAVDNHEQWLVLQQEQEQKRRLASVGARDNYKLQLKTKAPVFATIADAVAWLSEGRDEKLFNNSIQLASTEKYDIPLLKTTDHIQVLVTGSVRLVGGFLRILDPNMNDKS